METPMETAEAARSLADTAVKRIARLSKARCRTEVLVTRMVKEMPRAT
jgi:hypothetical protein